MRSVTKRWIIAGAVTVMALGLLTACTKTAEKKEDGTAAEEELPSEQADGKETGTAKDADAQDAETGEGVTTGEEEKLEGRIEKIPEDSDDSFIIAKLVTEEENGVSEIGDDPEEEKITVVYSMDTGFVKRTIRDGGANSEEKEGTAADLQEGFLVEIKGSYDSESVFFASEVKIIEVVS